MAINDSSITEKSKFSWTVLLVVVMVALSVAGFAYNVSSGVAVHHGNTDIHHSTSQLDDTYTRCVTSNQQFQEMTRRLDRIEAKLDRLQ